MGGDPPYNHAHLSLGLSCGGIRDDDSGGKSSVAPLPEPDASDACVVMRFSAAEDDSGGKSPVSPPGARFSDTALATSKYLCRTAAGAAIATFATEKTIRIRVTILSGSIFVD